MSTIQVFWHQSAPLCFVQALCIWHSTSWVSPLKMIYLNFVQVPDLTAFITKRVFSTVIMCLSTIVTYHVKKCASVAVIVYLISKTLWSYNILNTYYHRHIMQIIANLADLGQIAAIIVKEFIDHRARNLLVSNFVLLLFTYNQVPGCYVIEYWL